MPGPANEIEIAFATDTGKVRLHNEDSVDADAAIGLAVLADGLGGHNAGEVASNIAVATLMREIRQAIAHYKTNGGLGEPLAVKLIRENFAKANAVIHEAARNQPRYAGMGTTLVVALFHNYRLTVGHIGDSRLYRLHRNQFERLTHDHSRLQEQIDSGVLGEEQARHSPIRNVVTRALGVDLEVEAEIHTHDVEPGDIYLLCSDGLSDMVMDDDIHTALYKLRSNLRRAVKQLVTLANDSGGRDNISVILVRVIG